VKIHLVVVVVHELIDVVGGQLANTVGSLFLRVPVGTPAAKLARHRLNQLLGQAVTLTLSLGGEAILNMSVDLIAQVGVVHESLLFAPVELLEVLKCQIAAFLVV